jgi:1-deoxy-D-xylulose-5-phosphate reductoisomerase
MATCTLNAADEVAVEAFLERQIGFPAIAEVVEETLSRQSHPKAETIVDVLVHDRLARETARRVVQERLQ